MEELTFDLDKIKKVKMSQVHPNTWNPKEKNHAKVDDIVESIKMHGFKQPLQVRTHPTIKDEWEIIDGEQRYTAMDNLGADEIYIYDNGDVSDEDAQNETLWWQVQVPFEKVKLAELVLPLDAKGMKVPYTKDELLKMKEAQMKDPNAEPEKKENTTIKLTAEQYHIVMQAVEMVKEDDEQMTPGRALELICGDYLAGS